MKAGKKAAVALLVLALIFTVVAGMLGAKFALDKLNTIFGKLDALEDNLGSRIDLASHYSYIGMEKTEGLQYALAKSNDIYEFDYSWVENQPPLVAHAFGGIKDLDIREGETEEYTYTNSREAFYENYKLGHRIFEVDFELTSPGNTLVAYHDEESWRSWAGVDDSIEFSHELFMSTPISGKFSPMDYRDIIDLMVEYPDIYIITDSKYLDKVTVFLEFSQLVRYAEETDPTVLDRLVPQIYHEDMLQWVMEIYPFKSVVYTLYASARTPEQVYDFCESSGVKMVTCRDELSQETIDMWSQLGIMISVHTINDNDRADELMAQGIDLLYTDFLSPKDFE